MLVGMASRHDDDATLVAAFKAGDQQAFTLLFERWFDRSYDVAWRIVRNQDTAAEVAQDTLLASWQGIQTLRDDGAFGGWVLRTARNKALNRLQKDGRSGLIDAEDALDVRGAEAPTPDVALDVTAAERDDLVWAAAATLGERDASLLDLHLRHGLDAAELGEALGVTTNNAHQLLFRLKKKLGVGIRAWVLWHGGRPRCDDLAAVLAAAGATTFDGTTAKVIERHAEDCPTCEERKAAVLAPEAMFAAVPLLPAPLLIKQQAIATLVGSGVPLDVGLLSGSAVGDVASSLHAGSTPGADLGSAVSSGAPGSATGSAAGQIAGDPTSVLGAVHDAGATAGDVADAAAGVGGGHDGPVLATVGDAGASLATGAGVGGAVAAMAPPPPEDATSRAGSSRRMLAAVGAASVLVVIIVLVLLSGRGVDDPALETAGAGRPSTTTADRDEDRDARSGTSSTASTTPGSPSTTVAAPTVVPPSTVPGAPPSTTGPTVAPPPTATTPTTAPETTTTTAPTTTTTVPAPEVEVFTADNQPQIDPVCQTFERLVGLDWRVVGAATVSIAGPGDLGQVPTADTRGVCVLGSATVTWTLTATGPGGTVTRDVTSSPPVIP